jgi:hypothetical protein
MTGCRVTRYALRVTGYGMRVAGYGYELRDAGYRVRVEVISRFQVSRLCLTGFRPR